MILYIHIDPIQHPSNLYINSSSNPQNCLCEVIDSSLSSNSNRPFAGAFLIIQQTHTDQSANTKILQCKYSSRISDTIEHVL